MLDNGVVHSNGNGTANGAVGFVPPVIVYPAPQAPPAAAVEPAAPEATPETLIFRAGLLTPDQLGELVQERVSSGRTVEQIVVDRGWASADAVASVLGLEPAPVEAPVAPVELAPPVELTAPLEVAAPVEVAAPAEPALPVELTPAPLETPLPPAAVAEPTPRHLASIPVEHAPVEHAPVEPVHVNPIPVEPTPVAQLAVEPIQVEPIQVQPIPVDPTPLPVAHAEQTVEVEFSVVLRFAGQEMVETGRFSDAAGAKAAAHAIARELASAGDEWPLLGGRFVRPEAVLCVDVDATVR